MIDLHGGQDAGTLTARRTCLLRPVLPAVREFGGGLAFSVFRDADGISELLILYLGDYGGRHDIDARMC